MRRAWAAIRADRRVAVSVGLGLIGLCVIDDTVREKKHISLELSNRIWRRPPPIKD
jgi:hypothetical protein